LKNVEYLVRIEGNCDGRGTEEYNMALDRRKTDTAMKYLINRGVNEKRISTIDHGKGRPLDPTHSEAALTKNRNDHLVLSR
jgi:peptidoglycan-associated lipoprotein